MVEPKELVDILDTFYEEEPKVGQIIMLRHNFENLNMAGEVVALERTHAHRGYEPNGDYEVVVYHQYKVKLAGLRKWMKVGEGREWALVTILDEKNYYKLNPDVVLPSKVDDLIANAKDEENEL